MPLSTRSDTEKFDFRVYLGIIFFRWKIIVVCFLYCLLAGVLYLQFTEKAPSATTYLQHRTSRRPNSS